MKTITTIAISSAVTMIAVHYIAIKPLLDLTLGI